MKPVTQTFSKVTQVNDGTEGSRVIGVSLPPVAAGADRLTGGGGASADRNVPGPAGGSCSSTESSSSRLLR